MIAAVKLYRLTFSRIMPDCCRFTPSCSAYALRALKLHGPIKGTGLTIWRLCRCQPFCRGGRDPVPPRAKRKRGKN